MYQDHCSNIVYNEDDVIDYFMSNPDSQSCGFLIDADNCDAINVMLDQQLLIKYQKPTVDQPTFDKQNQNEWFIPDEYKSMDIAKHILELCPTDAELQRCGHELLKFQEHGLFDLLKYLKYLVDVMQKNNIIWGVGRGSSVSSYVLYKMGVHRVNSMYYDLDVEEFLR